MLPTARVGDQTATGDTILGPGVPTVLVMGQPVSVMGDNVAGPNAVKANIVFGNAARVLTGKLPTARVSSSTAGVAPPPPPGRPHASTVAKGAPTVLLGG